MPPKTYYLATDEIRSVAVGYGAAYASDRITVDGASVGWCYREEPNSEVDSGWRFFAGDETQEYTDTAENFALYDINTIANYDPEITSLIDSSVGSSFERNNTGKLVQVFDDEV
jgi:hypothetical protein